jgi:hypothetical protein
LLRRQASEQQFTSAQFFAHRRRQLMARPHATQGLLGNADLLPRKLARRSVTVAPDGWSCQRHCPEAMRILRNAGR